MKCLIQSQEDGKILKPLAKTSLGINGLIGVNIPVSKVKAILTFVSIAKGIELKLIVLVCRIIQKIGFIPEAMHLNVLSIKKGLLFNKNLKVKKNE